MPAHEARYRIEDLAALDDAALAAVVAPGPAGVLADRLGTALVGSDHDTLATRLDRLLPPDAATVVREARAAGAHAGRSALEGARRHVVHRLFWPLLYWHEPDLYEELVAGEPIHPALIDDLHLEGHTVADIGAGTGRFTLEAARRGARVIAVDVMPPLLERLRARVRAAGVGDRVDVRQGPFDHLPLDDASVDIAVACSSLTSTAPFGGDVALAEACRVVRPGGTLVVIWPDDPAYFLARGFTYLVAPGVLRVSFADVASALRLAREFYPASAVAWIEQHRTRHVPFEVLGMREPRDACSLSVGVGDALAVGGPERERRLGAARGRRPDRAAPDYPVV